MAYTNAYTGYDRLSNNSMAYNNVHNVIGDYYNLKRGLLGTGASNGTSSSSSSSSASSTSKEPVYYTPGGDRYYSMGGGTWLDRASGLKSSDSQGRYHNYSLGLGTNYQVGEYIPYYHRTYDMSTVEGRAQEAADRAEAENVRRYYEILSGYQKMLGIGVDTSAIKSAYDNALTSSLQNLVSRGLSGTTILNNAVNQIAIQKQAAMDKYVKENYSTNLQKMLSFMENRNTGTGQLYV